MKKLHVHILLFVFLLMLMNACKKTDNFQSDQLADYFQLQVGKYITYRLDSLEFINFGTQDTIVSYLAKDVIDDSITDGLGRPSWRVIRYLSDTTGTQPWTPAEAYMVTVTRQDVEVVENNLRYIKLALPIVNGFSWLGNSYIDTRSLYSEYTYMDGWNYTYDSVGSPFNAFMGTIPNSITIDQVDNTSNVGDSSFIERDYSVEVYAKGIGLIYKNFLHSEYQPPNIGVPVGSTSGYGLTLNMVDHN